MSDLARSEAHPGLSDPDPGQMSRIPEADPDGLEPAAPGPPRMPEAHPGPATLSRDGNVHEALLVRHGLISHVAELPPGTPPSEARRFRDDASRVARNVIPLSETRLGLLLTGGGEASVSDIPHSLHVVETPPLRPAPPAPDGHRDAAPPGPATRADATPPAPSAPPEPSGIEARLAQIEARIADFDVDAVSARLEARLEEVLTRRVEALMPGPAAPAAADPSADPRVEDFWAGMEQVLRLLHSMAGRFEAAADARYAAPEGEADADGPTDPDADALGIGVALAGLEDAVALGLEAADAAREAHAKRLEGRLAQVEGRMSDIAATLSQQSGEIAKLQDTALSPARIGGLLADALAPVARDTASAQTSLRDIAEILGVALSQLDRRMEETATDLGEISNLLRSDRRDEALAAAIAERLEALQASLGDRGGVLSDALETSKRSMKNFWLASEDVLRRIDEALERLEAFDPSGTAAARSDPPEAGEQGPEAIEPAQPDAHRGFSPLT